MLVAMISLVSMAHNMLCFHNIIIIILWEVTSSPTALSTTSTNTEATTERPTFVLQQHCHHHKLSQQESSLATKLSCSSLPKPTQSDESHKLDETPTASRTREHPSAPFLALACRF